MGSRKQGFTLIELLAVIVILAIIAFITVPMILGVIDKTKKGAAEASALGYIDAVEKYMILSQLDKTKVNLEPGIYEIDRNDEVSMLDFIIPKVYAEDGIIYLNDIIKVKGDKPKKGWIEVSKNKVDYYSFVIDNYVVTKGEKTVKGNVTATKPQTGWQYTDSDSNGTINVGDEIRIGTESFYIISNDGTNIKALAKYNLYVGGFYEDSGQSTLTPYGNEATGLQDSTMLGSIYGKNTASGTTAYSSATVKGTNYSDYTGSIVEGYVNEYKTKLEGLGVVVIDATSITKQELENLGCSATNFNCNAAPAFISLTSYWGSTADGTSCVWSVKSNWVYNFNSANYSAHGYFGVRPVITILKSSL